MEGRPLVRCRGAKVPQGQSEVRGKELPLETALRKRRAVAKRRLVDTRQVLCGRDAQGLGA